MRRCITVLLVLAAMGEAPMPAAGEETPLKVQDAAAKLVKGNAEEAVAAYSEALRDETLPNDRRAAILTDRGVAYARLNQPKLAIDDFNRAVQLFPEYAAAYNNRGNSLLSLGLGEEAIKDFDRAIVLAPGYAVAYNNRAGARMRLGHIAEAFVDYTKAIELMPQSATLLNGRGRALLDHALPYAAMRDFTRAIAVDARFGPGYRWRAEAKLELAKYEEAIEDLSRAIAFEPQNAEFHVRRGQAYLLAKNTASAIKDFTRAAEIAPQLAMAYAGRGLAHVKVEAYEEAESDLARALELQPRSAEAYAYRAWLYVQSGRPDIGAKELEKALKIDANRADVLWAKGEVERALGRIDDAVVSLKSALALKAGHPEARELLDALGAGPEFNGDVEVPGLGFERWRVVARANRYFALHDDHPTLRVPLEMFGAGEPRLLEWELKKPPLKGIGVLRFHSGKVAGSGGPEDVEQIAVIDLPANSLVSLQLHRQGDRVSKWTWEGDKVIVASIDGVTDEIFLRGAKANDRTASQPQHRIAGPRHGYSGPAGTPWNLPNWGHPPYDGRGGRPVHRQKPKTLFDFLLGN
jgi:tetratricopeptide (TPR) repeat protein